MKFAKQLETEAESIPIEWRPYLIQYKTLKKMITKITLEIEGRGLSASLLNKNNARYYFTGKPPHVRPSIEFIFDPSETKTQESSREQKIVSLKENVETDQSEAVESVVKELLNITLDGKERRSIVIELKQDDEFFEILLKEMDESSRLQDDTSEKFKAQVTDLELKMAKLASPQHDMYHWRKIFSIYMDAHIFQGNKLDKSKKQLQWFLNELSQTNQLKRLKSKASKSAFEQFIALNTDLITIQHYQLLNQTAMRKILKKHDKQSGLSASDEFNQLITVNSPQSANILYAVIIKKVTSIVPQPDDYACPICMCVAWRPIRLKCNHIYCVRCLVIAQRQKMSSCPLCRHATAVSDASAENLDEGLQNFLKLYFPQEIKSKRRDNEKEQAIEDIQAMTGKRYSEEQLLRMSQSKCCIM